MSAVKDLSIAAVNLGQRKVMLDDGQFIPITDMMDAEGELTTYPGFAAAFVAGPCNRGRWYVDQTSSFKNQTPN